MEMQEYLPKLILLVQKASGRTGSNFLRGESGKCFNKMVLFWPEMAKIDGFKLIFTIFGLNMSIISII